MIAVAAPGVELLDDLGPHCVPAAWWERLLAHAPGATPFMTGEWLRAWWRCFGRGRLLPIVVRDGGEPVLLAPLFADGGMVYFVGAGGSDYLDFPGAPAAPDTLARVLALAREHTPGFVGFCFHHVPEDSATPHALRAAAALLDMDCVCEGEQVAPALDLRGDPERAARAASKRSLVRHERWFAREGALEVHHLDAGAAIAPRLDAFFEQHVARWRDTGHPSLFLDPAQRRFYHELTREAGATGWLRFTSVEWRGRPIACHFGFCYRGSYLWYKPSFAIDLARRSPGEVLLRHLLLAAREERTHCFDFGLGDEAFKQRFASGARQVRDWGLYPASAREGAR